MTPAELTELVASAGAVLSACTVPVYLNRRAERAAAARAAAAEALRLEREAAAEAQRSEKNDANLRDDQREFIAVLQRENGRWRAEVESLHHVVDELRAEIERLRDELSLERRTRLATEARIAAETAERAGMIPGVETPQHAADERRVSEAGRAAEQREVRRQDPTE